MPPIGELSGPQIVRIYKDTYQSDNNYLDIAYKDTLAECFDDPEEYAAYAAEMTRMANMGRRLTPVAIGVMAKMQLLEEQHKPYTLEDLLDLKKDPPGAKAIADRVKSFVAAPANVQMVEREDPEQTLLREKKQLFYINFFKPYGDKLSILLRDKILQVLDEHKGDPEGFKQAYNAYMPLTSGLWDAYSQQFANKTVRNSLSELDPDEIDETSERLQIINSCITPYIAGAEKRSKDLHDHLNDDDLEDGAAENCMWQKCSIQYGIETTAERLRYYEKMPMSDEKRHYGIETTRIRDEYFDSFEKIADEGKSLMGYLTAKEKAVFVSDPDLYAQIHFEIKPDKHEVRMFLGNLDLQLEKEHDEVNTEHLEELKSQIERACTRQIIKEAKTGGLDRESLSEMSDNLKIWWTTLDKHTLWYDSSSNYRSMQSKLDKIREYTENLAGKEDITEEEKQHLRDMVEDTRDVVLTYLHGKKDRQGSNALSDNFQAKHDYEAQRVKAAKDILSYLEAKQERMEQLVGAPAREAARGLRPAKRISDESLNIAIPAQPHPVEPVPEVPKKDPNQQIYEERMEALRNKLKDANSRIPEDANHADPQDVETRDLLSEAIEAESRLYRYGMKNVLYPEYSKDIQTMLKLEAAEEVRKGNQQAPDAANKVWRLLCLETLPGKNDDVDVLRNKSKIAGAVMRSFALRDGAETSLERGMGLLKNENPVVKDNQAQNYAADNRKDKSVQQGIVK